MKELLLDTCNQTLSVAIADDKKLIAEQILCGFKNHAETIMPEIDALLKKAKIEPKDLEQITVASGPGSYTGIRIGVTVAKTLGYTLNIPVKCVSSLELLAYNLNFIENLIIVPMINARRNHVYAGVYKCEKQKLINLEKDEYQSIEDLQNKLNKYQNMNIALTGDYEDFEFENSYIKANQMNTLPNAYYLTFCSGKIYDGEEVHKIVPNYLKNVEAVENWQKENPNDHKENYIKTTK